MLSSLTRRLTRTQLDLHPDNAFDILSNSRRRQVILSVDENTESVSVGSLAVRIAAQEKQIAPEDVDNKQRKTVYIPLIQNHLDKMHEVGSVSYDDRLKLVSETETTPILAENIRRITAVCNEKG